MEEIIGLSHDPIVTLRFAILKKNCVRHIINCDAFNIHYPVTNIRKIHILHLFNKLCMLSIIKTTYIIY